MSPATAHVNPRSPNERSHSTAVHASGNEIAAETPRRRQSATASPVSPPFSARTSTEATYAGTAMTLKPVSPAIQYRSAPKCARPNRYPPTNDARSLRPSSRSRNARNGHSPTIASGIRSRGG